jgi:ATP phosphoribosyltransferase
MYVLWRAQIAKSLVVILVPASCHMECNLSCSLSDKHVVYSISILVVRDKDVAVFINEALRHLGVKGVDL